MEEAEIKAQESAVAEKPDLDTMLGRYFWRDILYEIINTMDPWDIDISELATRYSAKVEQMKEMNFRIPANVVIVSAVLLRMKAQFIGYKEAQEISADEFIDEGDMVDAGFIVDGSGGLAAADGEGVNGDPASPALLVSPKRVPKRRITALELLAAIQEVLEDRMIKSRIKDKYEEKNIVISLNTDIKLLIEETYNRVMQILARKETALFSELANTRDEKVSTFLSLLHLCNSQRLTLRQERIFEEIYINLYK